jgi:hypothetical protein
MRTDNARPLPLPGDAAVTMKALALPLAMTLALAPTPLFAQGGDKDLRDLKQQRDLADAFMREAARKALKNVAKDIGSPKSDKETKAAVKGLMDLVDRKRFFGSGTSDDELTAFRNALKKADQTGIKVGGEALNELIRASVYQRITDKEIKSLAEEVGKQHGNATADTVLRAVAAEYRARIATDLKAKKK